MKNYYFTSRLFILVGIIIALFALSYYFEALFQLRLEGGADSNRAAIGARVQVTTPDGVTQTQEVGGGYGHFGAQNDTVLHFGLGTSCDAEVTVRWPNRDLTEETFSIVSGYRYEVPQGGTATAIVEEQDAPVGN